MELKKIMCSFLILLIGILPIYADVNLVKSGGKYYVLQKDSNGIPQNIPVKNIIDLDDPTKDPGDPTPDPTNPLGIAVKNTTTQVIKSGGSATTGAGISSVFSLAAEKIDTFKTPRDSIEFVKSGIDVILNNVSDKSKWTEWRADITAALVQLDEDGKFKTAADYKYYYSEIKNGMNAATGYNGNLKAPQQIIRAGQAILDNLDIGKLIELIKLLMQLWEMFKPKT